MPIAIRTILCPLDFSDCSVNAFRYALDLAWQVGASEIVLLHAQPPRRASMPPSVEPRSDESVRRYLERELIAFAKGYEDRGVALRTSVVVAPPYEAILDAARDVDLIVMGTHGRGGDERFSFGSVAECIVVRSPVPVCTVSERFTARETSTLLREARAWT